MDEQADKNLDSGLYSMQQRSSDDPLGRTMRDVFRDVRPESVQQDRPIEENQDNTFPKQVYPGLPNINDDAFRRPATRKSSKACCRPRCVAMVLVVLAVVGGLVIALYFHFQDVKDKDGSSSQGTVVFTDETPKNSCNGILKEMGEQANFICNFGKRNVTKVIISTTTQLVRYSYTEEHLDGKSYWTIPGPKVNCSTVGRYRVQYTALEKLSGQSKTFYESTTVNVTGAIIASMTGDDTNINISCVVSGDCTNHHLSIYARMNDSEEIRVIGTGSCSGNHTDQHGYIKNCFTTMIKSTGYTHIGCRVQLRDPSFPEVEFKLTNCTKENVTNVNRTCPCTGRNAGNCTSEYIRTQSAINNIVQYTVCPATCEGEMDSTSSWCPFSSALESQKSGNNTCTNENNNNSIGSP